LVVIEIYENVPPPELPVQHRAMREGSSNWPRNNSRICSRAGIIFVASREHWVSVNWYQTSSPLKLIIDRLVRADGGNPDPTKTHGKNAAEAKELELAGG
jgi:hypothetical protein